MNHGRIPGAVAPVLLLVAMGLPLFGQEDDLDARLERISKDYQARIAEIRSAYEARITGLESEIRDLRDDVGRLAEEAHHELESGIDALVHEGHDHDHHGHDHAAGRGGARAPAIGVVGDFVFAGSTGDGGFDSYDRWILRGVEIDFAGEVDQGLEYYVAVFFTEEEVELEEAYGVASDLLPLDLRLKFGRFNVDHGRTSPLHEHELPFVDKPGVIQEFLGGTLRGTGVELHRVTEIGRGAQLRWSLGFLNSPDGDAHAIAGPLALEDHHGDDHEDLPGRRDLGNFAYTARLATRIELGGDDLIEIGGSLLWAPERRTLFEDLGGTTDFVRDLEKLVVSLDLTYQAIDAGDGSGFVLQGEFLFDRRESGDPADGGVLTDDSFGFHVWGEYHLDRELSLGVAFDWFEVPVEGGSSWDIGAWVTWNMSANNRLRLEARWYDDHVVGDDFLVVMLQWTTLLGSHTHQSTW